MSAYAAAIAYIQSFILDEPRAYQARAATALDGIASLLAQLDQPHQHYRIVHITGSKGKGSTALFLEQILIHSGLRVGVFSSPHLYDWTERFRIAGRPISTADFTHLVNILRPVIAASPVKPTFFDILTAMGLLLFRQQQVDIAIVEVGLGGRLDATNIVQSELCCITSIELEHTDKLGNTLAAIAYEKAGIIKSSVPVICGNIAAPAQQVITARSNRLNAPVYYLGQAFKLAPAGAGQAIFSGLGQTQSVALPDPLPAAQYSNAAIAIACSIILLGRHAVAANNALQSMALPGRCEIVSRQPWIVVDSAHTLASAQALREFIQQLPVQNILWLWSFSHGKAVLPIVQALYQPSDRVCLTEADSQRSQPVSQVAAIIKQADIAVHAEPDPAAALKWCQQQLSHDDLLCVAGSVYLAGVVRVHLFEN